LPTQQQAQGIATCYTARGPVEGAHAHAQLHRHPTPAELWLISCHGGWPCLPTSPPMETLQQLRDNGWPSALAQSVELMNPKHLTHMKGSPASIRPRLQLEASLLLVLLYRCTAWQLTGTTACTPHAARMHPRCVLGDPTTSTHPCPFPCPLMLYSSGFVAAKSAVCPTLQACTGSAQAPVVGSSPQRHASCFLASPALLHPAAHTNAC
jgi:hypothetical protein